MVKVALLLGGDWRCVLMAPGLEAAAPEGGWRQGGRDGRGISSGQGGWELALHNQEGDGTCGGMSHRPTSRASPRQAEGYRGLKRGFPSTRLCGHRHGGPGSPTPELKLSPRIDPPPEGQASHQGDRLTLSAPCSGVDLGLEPSGSSGYNVPSLAWTSEETLAWGWAQDLLYSICLCLGSTEGTVQEGPIVFKSHVPALQVG